MQKETANEAYQRTYNDVVLLLEHLSEQLKAHHKSQASDPLNWEYQGGLTYVVEQIQNAVQYLGNLEDAHIASVLKEIQRNK